MMIQTTILDNSSINKAINRISYEIVEKNKSIDNLCIIGIISRGDEIAKRISSKIFEIKNKQIPTGVLDITKFRDDSKNNSKNNSLSKIDFKIDDKHVILVDDVMYTCRSARAAIDAIISLGRPLKIQLAVLIDRGHKELPIKPDFVGKNIPTAKNQNVKVILNNSKKSYSCEKVIIEEISLKYE